MILGRPQVTHLNNHHLISRMSVFQAFNRIAHGRDAAPVPGIIVRQSYDIKIRDSIIDNILIPPFRTVQSRKMQRDPGFDTARIAYIPDCLNGPVEENRMPAPTVAYSASC